MQNLHKMNPHVLHVPLIQKALCQLSGTPFDVVTLDLEADEKVVASSGIKVGTWEWSVDCGQRRISRSIVSSYTPNYRGPSWQSAVKKSSISLVYRWRQRQHSQDLGSGGLWIVGNMNEFSYQPQEATSRLMGVGMGNLLDAITICISMSTNVGLPIPPQMGMRLGNLLEEVLFVHS